MKKITFKSYITAKAFRSSKYTYLANRFSSSPYFDQTYDDDISIFDYRDNKELSWGLAQAIEMADHKIENESTYDNFKKKVESVINKILKS